MIIGEKQQRRLREGIARDKHSVRVLLIQMRREGGFIMRPYYRGLVIDTIRRIRYAQCNLASWEKYQ